jgi:hypothetical protein
VAETVISAMCSEHDAEDVMKFVLDWSNIWMKYDGTLAGGLECVGWQAVDKTLFGLRISGLEEADKELETDFRTG